MRKIILGVVAAAAIATPLVAATAANATVAVDNGIVHVDKGDMLFPGWSLPHLLQRWYRWLSSV